MKSAETIPWKWKSVRTLILIAKNLFILLRISRLRHTSCLTRSRDPNVDKYLLRWFKGKEQTDQVQPLNIEELQETPVDMKS